MKELRDRTERILAILLLESMKGSSQREKAVRLSLAGFTNFEIADLLQTSTAVVAQHLYEARKSTKRRKR
jgi:DNA-binding NarL/FixJ family response regulator